MLLHWHIVLTVLVLGLYVHAQQPQQQQTSLPAIPPEGRGCTQKPFYCTCGDLWQSDCRCDGSDTKNATCRNCEDLCTDLWRPGKTLADFNVSCHVPVIRQFYVRLFIRSKHDWSTEALMSFKTVLEVMGDSVLLRVDYYGDIYKSNSGKNVLLSPAGYSEVEGDMVQLCAMRYYPDYAYFFPFFACMSRNISSIPYNAGNCSLIHGLDYQKISRCVSEGEGHVLLEASVQDSMRFRVSEPLPVLLMDGRPFRASVYRSAESFMGALCYLFDHPTRPFPWWVFGFMGSIILAVLVVVFVVKQWSSDSIIDFFKSIFFFDGFSYEEVAHWEYHGEDDDETGNPEVAPLPGQEEDDDQPRSYWLQDDGEDDEAHRNVEAQRNRDDLASDGEAATHSSEPAAAVGGSDDDEEEAPLTRRTRGL